MDDLEEARARYKIDNDDFDDGKCEICHENVPVTSVILTFWLRVPFDDLAEADRKRLLKEANQKKEPIPEGMNCMLDPLLGGELCRSCLAKGLLASSLRLDVVHPK
ncbi:MAG: hypothetical protein ACREQW_03100 [Candidatus Binatia bacterium]